MVRVEKLVVQGFKSFKRKTSIPFPTGFSIITGPNGAGKSNLGDAMTFVLGRSSSRTLRAKKAQDLIFHGSKKKPGSDYAKVSIYFNDVGNNLPTEEKLTSISRRINKNGVSTYRLNGKVVTRQQIVDMFSQVGIHPDGHNIIQQGDVNQIVEMDASERREIIDEISGIREFDDKRNKAMKEMEKIEGKIREAEIVLNEKNTIMEKLKRERDMALQYKELEDKLEKVRAAVIWRDFSGTEGSLESITKRLEEKEKESEGLENRIEGFDRKLVEEEERLENLTKSVLKASDQIEVTKRIAKLQSEIERKRDRIDSNNREIERLRSMIDRVSSMDRRVNPGIKQILTFGGVNGMLSDLITVPREYNIAVEVAGGSHMQDIVVDTTTQAVSCVKHLKANKLGRARFLPMDKIQSPHKQALPQGAIGWLSELIHHEQKYTPVVEYVFGRTACVKDIERAKQIARTKRVRMVTLDGDLMEASGAITGGYYRKRQLPDTSNFDSDIKMLTKENEKLEFEIKDLNEDLEILAEKERKTKTITFEKDRVKLDETLKRVREDRKDCYERKLILQQEIGKLNIQKAKLEAKFENLKVQLEGEDKKEVNEVKKEIGDLLEKSLSTLKQSEREILERLQEIGVVNMKAIDDYESFKTEFDDFREKVDKIVEEKKSIEDTVRMIEEKRTGTFMKTFTGITKNFSEVYKELTGGDADLGLETPNNIDSGLLIKASPPGKKLLNIDSMSGGEKTLTAFAFLFAIQRHKPAPFYILDEADATLDKRNTKKVADLIRKQSQHAQFIVISHNDALVREADQIYGVSMTDGESKVMGIELPKEIQKEQAKNN